MNPFRPMFSAVALMLIAALSLRASSTSAPTPEFRLLFNGTNLGGWTVPPGDNGHWKVVNGVIDYDAMSEATGDKNLWTAQEYRDFILRIEWRLTDTPYTNPHVPYILPDGSHARDRNGQPLALSLPDADSGILFRGGGVNQVNIWTWPIGSGELYGYRMNPTASSETRAAVTPRTQADKPVGEWNAFEITLRGDRISVVLNGVLVIDRAQLSGIADRGRIGLQHHGEKRDGRWVSSPSLVQYRNISIKELDR